MGRLAGKKTHKPDWLLILQGDKREQNAVGH